MAAVEGTPQKSSAASKWLIGCGVGCGVVILILIILAASGYFFIKNITEGFKETEELTEALTEKYGAIREFCPDPEGAIPPERIEAFLAVRNSLGPIKEKFERSIDILSQERDRVQAEKEPSAGILTRIRAGFGIIPLMAEFINLRHQALLDNGMGLGEYYYIYVVAYYSFLGKSPADGFEYGFMERAEERRRYVWDEEESREDHLDRIRRRLHRMVLPMLQNQYQKLQERGLAGVRESWLRALEREVRALEEDRFRLPWQDGLPDVLKNSLLPFRERLEESYSKVLNSLEFTVDQR